MEAWGLGGSEGGRPPCFNCRWGKKLRPPWPMGPRAHLGKSHRPHSRASRKSLGEHYGLLITIRYFDTQLRITPVGNSSKNTIIPEICTLPKTLRKTLGPHGAYKPYGAHGALQGHISPTNAPWGPIGPKPQWTRSRPGPVSGQAPSWAKPSPGPGPGPVPVPGPVREYLAL